jgi:hypothetical protein
MISTMIVMVLFCRMTMVITLMLMVIMLIMITMVVYAQFCAVTLVRVAASIISLVMVGCCRWTMKPSKFRRFCPQATSFCF